MRKISTFLAMHLLAFTTFSQASWSSVGSNVAGNSIRPQILIHEDTAFVAYINASGSVELKKNTGSTWALVGTFPTTDNKFDFDSYNGQLLISTIEKQNNADNSAFEFFLHMRTYSNGQITIIEDENIGFGPLGSNTIDIFDVAVNPFGGYGVVFRFNNNYPSTYLAKTGTNPWYSTLYYAVGGNSGVKDSKLTYNSEFNTAIIYSCNQTLAGGTVNQLVAHGFAHEMATSTPTQTVAPVNHSSILNEKFRIVSHLDTLFITGRVTSTEEEVILNQVVNSNAVLGTLNLSLNLGSYKFDTRLHLGDDYVKYVSYIDEDYATTPPTYPGKIFIYEPDFTNPELIGNMNFNDVGNMVGEYDVTVNYAGNPEFYAVFQYGPPFNNTKVRKYACAPAPDYLYDAANNILSTSEILTGSPQYQWYDCSSILDAVEISGANASTYEPTSATGSYIVHIMNGNCSTQSDCIEISDLSISKNTPSEIKVYPNPTENNLYVDVEAGTMLSIVTMLGQEITTIPAFKGINEINTSHLTPGIYLLKSTNGHTTQFIKK